jgi:hypothetical protein
MSEDIPRGLLQSGATGGNSGGNWPTPGWSCPQCRSPITRSAKPSPPINRSAFPMAAVCIWNCPLPEASGGVSSTVSTARKNGYRWAPTPIPASPARDKRDAGRKLLAAGVDPSEHRKAEKAAGDDKTANSFEVIAREWFAKHSPTWVASHADKIIQRLEGDAFPWLGKRPVADITAKELLATESPGLFVAADRKRAIASNGQPRPSLQNARSTRAELSPMRSLHDIAVHRRQALQQAVLRGHRDLARGHYIDQIFDQGVELGVVDLAAGVRFLHRQAGVGAWTA